eukprot:1821600-Pyramimonas_sp.AAC.1
MGCPTEGPAAVCSPGTCRQMHRSAVTGNATRYCRPPRSNQQRRSALLTHASVLLLAPSLSVHCLDVLLAACGRVLRVHGVEVQGHRTPDPL